MYSIKLLLCVIHCCFICLLVIQRIQMFASEMTDSEEEGGKGNYLRVHVKIDISQILSRFRKVWSKGKVIGWAALKYKGLPNFCYWCAMVSYDDRDYERWLRSQCFLKKGDQH